eukprot:6665581-Alexandrium_andersonii.AAC.1
MKGSPDGVLAPEDRHHEVTAPKSGPPRRSHARHRHPLKSSPCSKVLEGVARKALGEEVCRGLRSVDLDQ